MYIVGTATIKTYKLLGALNYLKKASLNMYIFKSNI